MVNFNKSNSKLSNLSEYIYLQFCAFFGQIEYAEDMEQISITDVLLEVRQYRAGLIQTPDQLRFTYLAILEGARVLMPEIFKRAVNRHLQSSAAGMF